MIINVQPSKREARSKLFPLIFSLMFSISCTLMLERPKIRHHCHRYHQRDDVQRQSHLNEVSKAIVAHTLHDKVRLIANRRTKAGRGCITQ